MQITEMELIFLNSITPGIHIWGIPLRFKRTEKFSETCRITIESLMQKKLLESEVQLTARGAAAAKLIDDYKHAEKHVLINRMHLALLPETEGLKAEFFLLKKFCRRYKDIPIICFWVNLNATEAWKRVYCSGMKERYITMM